MAVLLSQHAAVNRRSRNAEVVTILDRYLSEITVSVFPKSTPTDPAGVAAGVHITEAMLRTNPVSLVDQATAANQRRANVLPDGGHDFQPQTKNARCGECGKLRHQHGSAL